MKHLAPLFLLYMLLTSVVAGCKFAPGNELGDTVAASVFEPEDTSLTHKKKVETMAEVKDSIGMYLIGEGSNKDILQLVSYPSCRDTMEYGKTRHIKVVGSAQIGNLVSVEFYHLSNGDSLVSKVIQIKNKVEVMQSNEPASATQD